MFFLAATVVSWIGGDFVDRKEAAKNIFRHCRVTVLGKLFTPIVPLFTKQRNW